MKWITYVLLLLVAAALVTYGWRIHQKATDHGLSAAKMDIAMIVDAVRQLPFQGSLPVSGAATTNWDARSLYRLLAGTNEATRLIPPQRRWDSAQCLVDPWGRPFRIAPLKGDHKTPRYLIWSIGPNGRDEQGTGDDIGPEILEIRLPTPSEKPRKR